MITTPFSNSRYLQTFGSYWAETDDRRGEIGRKLPNDRRRTYGGSVPLGRVIRRWKRNFALITTQFSDR